MKKYTIKSTSEEGVYFLVNGWNKCKTFWFSEKSVLEDKTNAMRFFFNKPSQAKASLTRLLKVMPDYATDEFELVEVAIDKISPCVI
jgi:hypothetical protein